jgi:hypothetical protein
MRPRALAVVVLAFALGLPAFAAYDRGNVLLKFRAASSFDALVYNAGWPHAAGVGFLLIEKTIPMWGAGHFLMPAPNVVLFHDGHTMSLWDGVDRLYTDPGKGYDDIFRDDAELTEIAPLRGDRFLVATREAKLIELDLRGRIADFHLPGGAQHIEALGNDCTVLYTTGADARVRRLNICGGSADADFGSLPEGQVAGAMRQLPGGDVLVAGGSGVFHFTSGGALLRVYPMNGVTHIALSTDGATFWAAGVGGGGGFLRQVDPRAASAEEIALSNPGSQSIAVPIEVSDLVVCGEWRAAAQPIRTHAARR